MAIKAELAELVEEQIGIEVTENDIERPDRHADFAYPCMAASSELGKNPREIAEDLSNNIEADIIESMEVAGPGYLNFHLDRGKYAEKIDNELNSEAFGVEQKDDKVLVEFSCPNLAKPMHIGHLRNNFLGDSIQRIMRFVGHDVTSENYIGDWGTKHGQVIYAFKKWGSMEEFEEDPMAHMYELYVKLHDKASEEDKRKSREWSKKIEEGDEEAVELWEMFREATIEHNESEYERMGISFDRVTGESVVAEEAQEVIEEGLEKGIFQEDEDGSIYVEFEKEELPSTVVKRDDGSTLYLSRDVANIRKREREGFDQNLYIVANEQDLHFQQLFAIAERFGIEIHSEHISYGMLHLQDGSISSSKGNIITFREVMDESVEKASEIEGRDIDNDEAVGLGALKYANLSVSRPKDISFSWEQVLSFEGDSGPYLQYSNVRAKSILREASKSGSFDDGEFNDQEYELLKKLAEFPEKVEAAAEQREPAKIANYLSTLSEEFNSFYHECEVLGSEGEVKRLKLVELFVEVSDQGLELLGIESLNEM